MVSKACMVQQVKWSMSASTGICQLPQLTWSIIGGKVEACDLSASKLQHANQLTLVCDARLQTRDSVGVEMARDHHLFPWALDVFLLDEMKEVKRHTQMCFKA